MDQLGELSQMPMIFELILGPLAQVLVPEFLIYLMLSQNRLFILNQGRFMERIVVLYQSLIRVVFLNRPVIVYQIQLFLCNKFHRCSWLLGGVPQRWEERKLWARSLKKISHGWYRYWVISVRFEVPVLNVTIVGNGAYNRTLRRYFHGSHTWVAHAILFITDEVIMKKGSLRPQLATWQLCRLWSYFGVGWADPFANGL